MREGNVVGLLYKASEGHMGCLTFLLVGFFRFDPVKRVIYKELWEEDLFFGFFFYHRDKDGVSVNIKHIIDEL